MQDKKTLIEIIWVMELKLHEIWQVERKWSFDQ